MTPWSRASFSVSRSRTALRDLRCRDIMRISYAHHMIWWIIGSYDDITIISQTSTRLQTTPPPNGERRTDHHKTDPPASSSVLQVLSYHMIFIAVPFPKTWYGTVLYNFRRTYTHSEVSYTKKIVPESGILGFAKR